MKCMIVLALVAVLVPAALSKPSGWGHLGGVLGLGVVPGAVSHTSVVQTHPSPVILAHAAPAHVIAGPAVVAGPAVHAAVAPGPRSAVIAGPSGIIAENQGVVGTVAVAGHGHGLGLGLGGLGLGGLGLGHLGGVGLGHHW